MDMTLIPPLVCGGIGPMGLIPNCAPSGRNILGILGPVISASRMPTWYPSWRSAMASSPLTSDLPTPPLPLMTAITRRILFRSSAAPFSDTAPVG
jgi:hypothetical protein